MRFQRRDLILRFSHIISERLQASCKSGNHDAVGMKSETRDVRHDGQLRLSHTKGIIENTLWNFERRF